MNPAYGIAIGLTLFLVSNFYLKVISPRRRIRLGIAQRRSGRLTFVPTARAELSNSCDQEARRWEDRGFITVAIIAVAFDGHRRSVNAYLTDPARQTRVIIRPHPSRGAASVVATSELSDGRLLVTGNGSVTIASPSRITQRVSDGRARDVADADARRIADLAAAGIRTLATAPSSVDACLDEIDRDLERDAADVGAHGFTRRST